MTTELSAGGIVVQKKRRAWCVLVLRDMNDVLTFPKGLVEHNESLEEAAAREVGEETGITQVTLMHKLPVIRYMYRRNGLIAKTVHYFIFTTTTSELPSPQKEEGIHDVSWLPIDEALTLIGYPKTNKPLLLKTKEYLSTLS